MDQIIREMTIRSIIEKEWAMFQAVHDINGQRPFCQDDYDGFYMYRQSQFSAWNDKVLSSYASDVYDAEKNDRNLIFEKYALMMRERSPSVFEEITGGSISETPEQAALADRVTAHTMIQAEYCSERYPHVMSRGRPLYDQATGDTVSVETYERSELCTYSPETLRALLDQIETEGDSDNCLYKRILDQTAKLSGYQDLAQAEEKLSGQVEYSQRS